MQPQWRATAVSCTPGSDGSLMQVAEHWPATHGNGAQGALHTDSSGS
jgi:hypothetical protein